MTSLTHHGSWPGPRAQDLRLTVPAIVSCHCGRLWALRRGDPINKFKQADRSLFLEGQLTCACHVNFLPSRSRKPHVLHVPPSAGLVSFC